MMTLEHKLQAQIIFFRQGNSTVVICMVWWGCGFKTDAVDPDANAVNLDCSMGCKEEDERSLPTFSQWSQICPGFDGPNCPEGKNGVEDPILDGEGPAWLGIWRKHF